MPSKVSGMVCAMRDFPLVASISLMFCAMMLSASRVSKVLTPSARTSVTFLGHAGGRSAAVTLVVPSAMK